MLIAPPSYDVLWFVLFVPLVILTVAALVSLVRSQDVSGAPVVVWMLLILFVPALGAIAWFVLRNQRVGSSRQHSGD